MELRVGSFNILNTFRWAERGDLCRTVVAGCGCELLALQEVNHKERQAEELAKCIKRKTCQSVFSVQGSCRQSFTHPSVRGFRIDGNAVLARPADKFKILGYETHHLSNWRSCTRVLVRLKDLKLLLSFVCVHLHHTPQHPSVRAKQIRKLLEWAQKRDQSDDVAVSIIAGDFNAVPSEAAYSSMVDAGYRSAYCEANGGSEPETTWFVSTGLEDFEGAESFPEGLYAEEESAYDEKAESLCIDYIWVRARDVDIELKVETAGLIGKKDIRGTFPSDHFGVVADLIVTTISE